MARAFAASTHNLRAAVSTTIAGDGTIFLRFQPSWNYNDNQVRVLFQYGNNTAAGFEAPSFQKFSDNKVYIGFNGNALGDQRISVSALGCFSNGTWANHLFTWSDSNDQEYYYCDNSLIGSRTSTLTTFNPSYQTIGNYDASGTQANLFGNMAEFARWNRVLDASERAILQVTNCPLSVPFGLVEYRPLGWTSPEIDWAGGQDLTVTNSTSVMHPRVLRPRRMQVLPGTVGGGGSSVSATVAATIGGATCSGSATFTAPTYSATASPTVGGATASASASHTTPIYTASATPTTGGATVAASASFATVIRSATATATIGGASASASATFTAPVYTATAATTIGGTTVTVSATHTPPSYTATASPTIGGATATATASFATSISTATAAVTTAGVSVSIAATFTAATFVAFVDTRAGVRVFDTRATARIFDTRANVR